MKYPTTRLVFDRKKSATKSTAKIPKKGLIQVEVSYNRQRKYISTGEKVYLGQWNEAKGIIGTADMAVANQRIDNLHGAIRKFINDLIDEGKEFGWDALDRFVNKSKQQDIGLIDWIANRIEERNDLTTSSKRAQRKILTSLDEFGKLTAFCDISLSTINAYDNWLHGKYDKQTTIHSYHKVLRTYVNMMEIEGLIADNPYNRKSIDKGKSEQGRYLTAEEMERLEKVGLSTDGLIQARDMFVVQMYTGLAYSDLREFNWRKVQEREGRFVILDSRKKTGEAYYIVLLSPVVEILKKYNYTLPLVNLNKYNDRLKVVADAAGINKPVSSHWARRSAGYWMLNNGAPIEVVSKVLGHASVKQTEQVYAKILNKTVERAFDMLEGKLKKGK